MKAFTRYTPEELDLRRLLKKLEEHGNVNCDFETFTRLYRKWYFKSFPGTDFSPNSVILKCDLFMDFVKFLENEDI